MTFLLLKIQLCGTEKRIHKITPTTTWIAISGALGKLSKTKLLLAAFLQELSWMVQKLENTLRIKLNGTEIRKYIEYHPDSAAASDAGREVMAKKTKNTE